MEPTAPAIPVFVDAPSGPETTAFGQRLRSLRRQRGWTQRQLGAALFFSREYVALVERGVRPPTEVFVERAEAALVADGALSRLFEPIDVEREREARLRASYRRQTRRKGRIAMAAGRLRAATDGESAAGRSPVWWAAFDDLQQALCAELNLIDAASEIDGFEQRCAELTAGAGQALGWAEVLVAAVQDFAEAGALLRQSLHGDHSARLAAVAGQLAVLTGDALLMLGDAGRADEWHGLADTVRGRAAPTVDDGHETDQMDRPDRTGSDDAGSGQPAAATPASAVDFPVEAGRWMGRAERSPANWWKRSERSGRSLTRWVFCGPSPPHGRQMDERVTRQRPRRSLPDGVLAPRRPPTARRGPRR